MQTRVRSVGDTQLAKIWQRDSLKNRLVEHEKSREVHPEEYIQRWNKETILKPTELKEQCQVLQRRNRRGLKYSLYANLRKVEKGIVSCSSLQKGAIHEPRGDNDGPGRILLETTCHCKNPEGKAKASGEERRIDTPEEMECTNIMQRE